MTDDFDPTAGFDDFEEVSPEPRGNKDFDRQVNRRIKELLAKDPVKRRDAAYWLGESGEPKSISALVTMYRKEKDKRAREAAKYALGMFKALEQAINGTEKEQQQVVALLEKVASKGPSTGRSSLSSATLMRINIVLGVLLIIIGGLAVVLPGLKGGGGNTAEATQEVVADSPTPTRDPLQSVNVVRQMFNSLRSDASTMQAQLLGLQTGGQIDCTIQFANPSPMAANTEIAELDTIIGQLNSANLSLLPVRDFFNAACNPDATPEVSPPGADEITSLLDIVTGQLRNFGSFDPAINAVEQAVRTLPTPTVPPVTETPSPTPSETPTVTPTQTVSPSIVNTHILALDSIISDMTNQRGANTLLRQYWTDAQVAGATDACQPPYPPIPPDYAAVDPQIAQSLPALSQAITNTNIGLSHSRQSWELFKTACANNTLRDQSAVGLQYVTAAADAFASTVELLDAVRLAIR